MICVLISVKFSPSNHWIKDRRGSFGFKKKRKKTWPGERDNKIHTVAISPTSLSRSCKNGVLTMGAWEERVAIDGFLPVGDK